MSIASRKLQPGATVTTDYSGRITSHRIVKRVAPACCQSGVLFWVTPPVPKSSGDGMDADWFEEVKP